MSESLHERNSLDCRGCQSRRHNSQRDTTLCALWPKNEHALAIAQRRCHFELLRTEASLPMLGRARFAPTSIASLEAAPTGSACDSASGLQIDEGTALRVLAQQRLAVRRAERVLGRFGSPWARVPAVPPARASCLPFSALLHGATLNCLEIGVGVVDAIVERQIFSMDLLLSHVL